MCVCACVCVCVRRHTAATCQDLGFRGPVTKHEKLNSRHVVSVSYPGLVGNWCKELNAAGTGTPTHAAGARNNEILRLAKQGSSLIAVCLVVESNHGWTVQGAPSYLGRDCLKVDSARKQNRPLWARIGCICANINGRSRLARPRSVNHMDSDALMSQPESLPYMMLYYTILHCALLYNNILYYRILHYYTLLCYAT